STKGPLETDASAENGRAHRGCFLGHFIRSDQSRAPRDVPAHAHFCAVRAGFMPVAGHAEVPGRQPIASARILAIAGTDGVCRDIPSSNAPGVRADVDHGAAYRLAHRL